MTTRHFPSSWRTPVTVERSGGRDPKGNPLPTTEHTVPDCLVSNQTSAEEALSRSDAPETSAWVYAPPGADFTSTDVVVVPESVPPRLWPSGRFQVSGEPDFGPLGTRVPLRRS